MLQHILAAYGLQEAHCALTPLGTGLINHTWHVRHQQGKEYVLQRINQSVFRQPEQIASNIRLVASHLRQVHPGYLFIAPCPTLDKGEEMFHDPAGSGYYRLYPFVNGSHTIDVPDTPGQAFEAARQFGLFTRLTAGLDPGRLHITLPNFHHLGLRYLQFSEALEQGNALRRQEAAPLIRFLQDQQPLVKYYRQICYHPAFIRRVTHHDTKISNVLLNQQDKGLCVIDLDTLMPGHFMSDAGDMMRTYLCPVNEEEQDTSRICIRQAFFRAILEGYGGEMRQQLTQAEQLHFVFAGKMMIYMQALRFLTDYLNNDIYYPTAYASHNLARAANQAALLQTLLAQEPELQQMVNDYFQLPPTAVPLL